MTNNLDKFDADKSVKRARRVVCGGGGSLKKDARRVARRRRKQAVRKGYYGPFNATLTGWDIA